SPSSIHGPSAGTSGCAAPCPRGHAPSSPSCSTRPVPWRRPPIRGSAPWRPENSRPRRLPGRPKSQARRPDELQVSLMGPSTARGPTVQADTYTERLESAFLGEVYRLYIRGLTDRSLDLIVHWFDSELKQGAPGAM